jgi:hypothetical protein
VARWGPFRCLVLSGLVINCCNKIRYNKDIGILYLHSDRMYDNLILGIHTMSIWFGLKTGCDNYPPLRERERDLRRSFQEFQS